MINLLPPEIISDITYARRNTQLLRWLGILLASILVLVAIMIYGQWYIKNTIQSMTRSVDGTRQQLKDRKLEETQKEVQTLSDSVKLANQVLAKQVLFSELLTQVGSVMPPGSSLSALSINKLQGGLDMNAIATDYQTATQVQINLQDPENKIFEKVDIVNITCTSGSTSGTQRDSIYPCSVTVRALFAKNNPFMLVQNPATGSAQ